eukprot:6592038-Ditylum_brightwellii.AAC.1
MANAELRYDDAIHLCLTVLKELGCRFPLGGVMGLIRAVVSVRTTVKMVKQTPTEVSDSLPLVTDPCKLAIMALLKRLVEWSASCGDKFAVLLLMIPTKCVRMTLSYGLYEMSAGSLSGLGFLSLLVLGDIDTACYIGERTLQMQERLKSEACKASVLFFLHVFKISPRETIAEFFKAIFGRLSAWNENWG